MSGADKFLKISAGVLCLVVIVVICLFFAAGYGAYLRSEHQRKMMDSLEMSPKLELSADF